MKLKLPHKFQAALLAAIASVSFTTLCSGALTAAFFLGSQAFAEDSPEESMPDEPDQIAEFDIGYTDPEASPEESDEQQKKLVDQATIKANEVGSNGVIGSSDGANQADTVDTVNLTSTTGSGTIFNTNGHIVTMDADMSGDGNLTKTGLGTLALNGSNSFSGDTTVSAGTLRVNNADGLTRSANVNVADGATLWFNSSTPASGSTPSITVRTNQEFGLQELVQADQVNDSNTPHSLYWNKVTADWTAADAWLDASGAPTTFAECDDVFFDPSKYLSAASDRQANLTQNTHVHEMTIVARTGVNAATNTVKVVVNEGSTLTLTVDFLNTEDNTELLKRGKGTLTTQLVGLAGKGKMEVAGNISCTAGTLNIEVGSAKTPTDVTFSGKVTGVSSFTVNEGSKATFSENVSLPGAQNLIMKSGATVNFENEVSLTAKNWRFDGDGTVNFNGDVEAAGSIDTFYAITGNLKVNVNKTLTPTAAQVDIRLDPGTELYIKELDMIDSNQETLYFTFKNTYGTTADRDSVQIDKMVVDGSRGIGTNLSDISGLLDYQAGGDINIKQLVNAEGATSNDIARLCNYVSSLKPVTQNGWGIAQVFNLGEATQEGAAFEGIIRLQDSRNDNDDWYGSADNHKKTVLVLNDEYVASEAVIELKNYSRYSDFGVGINTENAKVQGIKDYASGSYKSGNRSVIFSGPMASANTAIPESDDTPRTLELIGKTGDTASTVYSTSAGVDKNLNIVKQGAGVQEFKGDSSKFNGSIDAKDGLLRFLNTATLTVRDLTLAANGSTTDGTLAVRSGSSASSADGTAAVHGTLKVYSGSKLDSNLTMATGSTMNVRESLTTPQGKNEGKTDYVGGLDMLSNSLTLQSGTNLSDEDLSALLSMQWGERYELAYGLSSLTLGDTTYRTEAIVFNPENYKENNIDASQYFANLPEANYYICYSGSGSGETAPGGNVGTFYIFKAPEPTTGTLSLLALAALAARRRRK